ncbi:hypothetical protein [Pelagicoccus sp. SDUM812005]|uniref:hypothetical protein n=1 Tax=Pelagicoccus sp. SDUM812005 TaxID=3041257 RepID=UPI00280FA258|nr:hypothetical protein [Pelagicoccus sp. SDUM812005]MDQ8183411.1 hypothetical protein [Pelagicoccus sp. SDUM812005]
MKKKNIWFVYSDKGGEPRLIQVYSSRKSNQQMEEIVEQYWIDRFLDHDEALHYMNRKNKLPYKAVAVGYNNLPDQRRIICGPPGLSVTAIFSHSHSENEGEIEIRYRLMAELDLDDLSNRKEKEFSETIKK